MSAARQPAAPDALAEAAIAIGAPVFSCKADKSPCTARGFKSASADPDRIREMFARRDAAAIGLPMGRATGIVAVDIDVKDGARGRDWLEANAHRIPVTRRHQTQSGGVHLIFEMPAAEVRNTASKIAPGVDVRGDGGYIIVPPSPGYTVAEDADPAPMPDWLLQLAMPAPAPAPAPQRVPSGTPAPDGGTPYGRTALRMACDAIMQAADGAKHDTLNKEAYSIGGLAAAGELIEAEAFAALDDALSAIAPRCKNYRAAKQTLRQAFDKGKGFPRDVPNRSPAVQGEHPAQPMLDRLAREVANDTAPLPGLADFLDVRTWAAREIAEPDRLLGDFVTTDCRVFIVGPTGTGKTMLGFGLSLGMASGTGFLHWRSVRPARVLYIDGEMSAGLIKARSISELSRSTEIREPGKLIIYSRDFGEQIAEAFPGLGEMPPLSTPQGHKFIYALLEHIGGADVIVFDNVMSLLDGDMKEEQPWKETTPLVQTLSARKIGQIWLDHTGHDKSKQYGSSTKAWGVDAVGIMSTLPDEKRGREDLGFCLSFDAPSGKARRRTPENWSDFAPVTVRLIDNRWTGEQTATGKPVRSSVSPVTNALYRALLDALAVTPNPGETTRDAWYGEAARLGLLDPLDDADDHKARERKRAKLRKALAELKVAGWVAADGETVRNLLAGAG